MFRPKDAIRPADSSHSANLGISGQRKEIYKILRVFMILLLGFFFVFPAFLSGFFIGHDLLYHLNWSNYFTEQLWAGDFYPRWLANMNGGRGSPVFFFYGPIPYYFTSLFKPLLSHDPHGWLRLGLSSSLALAMSGLSAFLWLGKITDKKSAFLAAIFYMILPYHLAVDLYYRFAFAEFWAFVWMPLILYFTRQITYNSKTAILGFAISYALLIMTHLPTTLIFSLVPVAYAFVIAERGKRGKALLSIVSAMILGIGLSAIYLIPALTTQEYVSLNRMTEGRSFYEKGFLFFGQKLQPGVFQGFWRYVSWMTVLSGIVASCSFALCLSNHLKKGNKKEGFFWFFVSMIVIFMMFPCSKTIWQIFPVFQKIQFPWRFNAVLSVATVALFAIGLSSLNKPSAPLKRIAYAVVCALAWSQLLTVGNIGYEKATRKADIIEQFVIMRSLEIGQGVTEFLPRWVQDDFVVKVEDRSLDRIPTRVRVDEGTGNAQIITWEPRHIVLAACGKSELRLTVSQFFYPGWAARLLEDSRGLSLEASREGLLSVLVPPGEHRVVIELKAGLEERIGQIVSLVSVTVVFGLGVWFLMRGKNVFTAPM